MRYLKKTFVREKRIRLSEELIEKIEKICVETGESFNLVLNKVLERCVPLLEHEKIDKGFFYSSAKNEKFDFEGRIKIFQNDFLTVDLSEWIGKINLIVTSPPYNVGIEYGSHNDATSYDEYLMFTKLWLMKAFELLADDGRLCLNIPLDKNKNGLRSVYADIVAIAKDVGFKYQSTIIWNEQNISRRTAWGSWLSASAPYVIAPVETIVVMYKHQWRRRTIGISTITKEEFIDWTNGMWTFSGEKKTKIGHPAPFPIELPKRCIKLFSFKEDIVLDPFLGSGTTLIAAFREGRKGIGIEIDPNYTQLAIERLKKEVEQLSITELLEKKT